ncbi:endonuclease/exonuclease/phosphatase family protein [Pontibacter anaerobius]|uniref:Endonuclease/exonuclease/phosphatase family protein n=1 Tax=Pontibacter anaerobius TaxID=2993940 RepID=A0ABT3RGX6_9BACT|nr:endonuclease/exonuclease/phosphatase family protein [Pontibacter anaerobius]MCX2740746.1 endonuclease/exonuclease/phosphatase family protein [Pontibacter anaerobius]
MSTAKKLSFYLSLVAGTLLILITLLSLIYDVRFWFLKALDFPRVQVLIGLLLTLILFTGAKDQWKFPSYSIVVGMICSIAIQARFVLPYTIFASEAVETLPPALADDSRTFSLLVANVWMKNEHVDDFLQIVYDTDPDIVLAMETNSWWIEQLSPLQEAFPHKVVYPLDNTYGMALYSKLPLQNIQIKFLKKEKVPSIHTEVKLSGNAYFVLHAMHPVPPKPSKHPDNVGEEEEELLKVGKMVQQSQLPTVVAGDLNDVAWSKTSRLFGIESKLGDIRIGRGLYSTFDATSFIMRWPLDHIYVSNAFKVVNLQRLPKFGSDHFPLYAELALTE